MNRLILFLIVAAALMAGALLVQRQQSDRHARTLEAERAAWAVEKAELENALATARTTQPSPTPVFIPATPKTDQPVVLKPAPEEFLRRLATMKLAPGPGQARAVRQILALLDQLAQSGPDALPAIRQFLASNADVEYESAATAKGPRDLRSLTEAVLPPSLRLALFDVVRQIGGDDAEKLLAGTLGHTGRGLEVVFLAQLLEEMAPGKYRDAALAAAQALLNRGVVDSTERFQRDYLFSVLRRFNDASFASTAQAQMVQADGRIDRSALRYLQDSLGEPSIAIAAQLYKDPRITEADSRESLARVALTYVGANEQAGQLFHTAINDLTLKPDQRRELVEDLNRDGLSNKKALSPADLQTIANRYALTQTYLQQDYVQNDPVLTKAFLEANKDLAKMLERAAAAANPTGVAPAPRLAPGQQAPP